MIEVRANETVQEYVKKKTRIYPIGVVQPNLRGQTTNGAQGDGVPHA